MGAVEELLGLGRPLAELVVLVAARKVDLLEPRMDQRIKRVVVASFHGRHALAHTLREKFLGVGLAQRLPAGVAHLLALAPKVP